MDVLKERGFFREFELLVSLLYLDFLVLLFDLENY